MKRILYFIVLILLSFSLFSGSFRLNFDISLSKGISDFFDLNTIEQEVVSMNYENKMKVGYFISADFPIYKNIYITPCFGIQLGFQDYSKVSNLDNEMIVKYKYDFNFVFEDIYLKYDFLSLTNYLHLSAYVGFGFNQINHDKNIEVDNSSFLTMIVGGQLYFYVFKNTYLHLDVNQRLSLEKSGISTLSFNFGLSFRFN